MGKVIRLESARVRLVVADNLEIRFGEGSVDWTDEERVSSV